MNIEPCPLCSGTGKLLGTLGWIKYYRCRDCGIEFRTEPSERPSIFEDPNPVEVEDEMCLW